MEPSVMEAVRKLADNANEMIEFINETVLKDYENFVGVADQYNSDADNMNEILSRFAKMSMDLATNMNDVTEGINGIAVAVDESAKGISEAAGNTSAFVDASKSISGEINTNLQIADQLKGEVDKFKNI